MGKSNAFVVLFFVTSEVVLALVLHDWQVFISICCSSCWRHLPLFFNQTSPFSLVFCSGLFKGYPPPMPGFSHQVFNVFGIGPQQGLNIGYPKSYQHFPKIRIKWGQGIPGIPHSQTHKTSHCFTLLAITFHAKTSLSQHDGLYPAMRIAVWEWYRCSALLGCWGGFQLDHGSDHRKDPWTPNEDWTLDKIGIWPRYGNLLILKYFQVWPIHS